MEPNDIISNFIYEELKEDENNDSLIISEMSSNSSFLE
jgi:hypothetical protein